MFVVDYQLLRYLVGLLPALQFASCTNCRGCANHNSLSGHHEYVYRVGRFRRKFLYLDGNRYGMERLFGFRYRPHFGRFGYCYGFRSGQQCLHIERGLCIYGHVYTAAYNPCGYAAGIRALRWGYLGHIYRSVYRCNYL